MTREFLPKNDALLEAAAATDPYLDFDSAHLAFSELLCAVDENRLELPGDKQLEQRVRNGWAQYECILEAERAMGVLESADPGAALGTYELLPRYRKFVRTDQFLLEQCSPPALDPHLLMVGSGPLPITSYIFGKSEDGFGYRVTNVDASHEALLVGQKIMDQAGVRQEFVYTSGADVLVDPSVTSVIVAALAGADKTEKLDIIKNVATQLQPGARLSVRYATGVRRLFYPECVLTEAECEEFALRRVGTFEPPRDYMNAIGVYEKCS